MRYKLTLLLVLVGLAPTVSYGQDEVVTVQPSIMPIPFTKENEDIRTIIEEDPAIRIAIATIKQTFDRRGFTTIDYRGLISALGTRDAMTLDDKKSLKQEIIANSNTDIYIESDMTINRSSRGNSVAITMQAVDSYSGQSLANIVGRSDRFLTEDIGRLAEKAVDDCIEEFLNDMNLKFGQIVENGRSVVVDISFASDSPFNMSSEIGPDDDYLSDVLEVWFEDNAHKNNFRIKGVTDTNMILDDVRIPLKDAKTGRNYRPTRFASSLRKFIRDDLRLDCKTDVQGATIFVTIGNARKS